MQPLLQNILARPVALAVASCALAFGGIFALIQLPLGLAPSLDLPALSVHMSWGGASAESVEQTMTRPVEEIISALKGVRKVRSVSQEGRSRVSAEFDPQIDMNFTRLVLHEQLALFARRLPRGASHPVVERYVPEDIEQLQGFLQYSLAGPLPRSTLVRIADEEITPGLMRVEGVARVMLQGREERELRIELSPDRLSASGITAADVMAALEACHPGSCRGSIQGPAGVEGFSVAPGGVSLRDLEDMPVRHSEGLLRLRDVGTAAIVSSAMREVLRTNGKECVELIIIRDVNSSLPGTARNVRSCLAALSQRLPPSVELVCEMDQSRRMNDELNLLYRDAAFSLILLWGILALFLGSSRVPLVLILAVLLSIAGTFLALWILRIPLHLLTLTGLLLGIGRLLDDSIVVMENLRRWMESGTPAQSIVKGTHEVIMPVVASTLATAGALVPVFFLPRDLQVYFREFAITVVVSLSISLLVSFTVIPSAASHWKLEGKRMLVHPRGGISSAYRWLLGKALRHRMIVLLAAIWLFGIPVWLLPLRIEGSSLVAMLYNETVGGAWYTSARPVVNALLGGASYQFFWNVPHAEFLDAESRTYLVMQVDFPRGTDILAGDVIARWLEQDLLRAGAPRLTTHVLDGTIILRIEFPDSTVATALPQSLRNRCFRLAAQLGGTAVSVAGFGVGFTGGVDLQPSFAVRVFGYDYEKVKHIAESLRERLRRNPRVVSADIDRSLGNWSRRQEFALSIDRDAAVRYDLTQHEIASVLRNYTTSLPRSVTLNLQGARRPCVVTLKGSDRFSLTEMGSIAIPGKRPPPVPLGSLISVQRRAAPSEIVREDQQYVRWVSFEYRGPYRHAQAFLDATIDAYPLPEGYRFDRTDNSTVSGKDRDFLLLAALAALLIVFMVTASLYESLLDPFIAMLSVPFAYIGVFAAFVLAGVPFGRGGYLSVVFLTGLAVANGIVIVDFLARKREARGDSVELVIDASVCRLRPVLMTALTTAGGLVPMLLGDRTSIWYSLALGTFGGVLSSVTLTLVVIPVAYVVAHKLSPAPPLGRNWSWSWMGQLMMVRKSKMMQGRE